MVLAPRRRRFRVSEAARRAAAVIWASWEPKKTSKRGPQSQFSSSERVFRPDGEIVRRGGRWGSVSDDGL